jgi:hypothetical protein
MHYDLAVVGMAFLAAIAYSATGRNTNKATTSTGKGPDEVPHRTKCDDLSVRHPDPDQ